MSNDQESAQASAPPADNPLKSALDGEKGPRAQSETLLYVIRFAYMGMKRDKSTIYTKPGSGAKSSRARNTSLIG